MNHNEQRPNPDKLLNLVNNDHSIRSRGRLKVFFGASAGVGKTYAMLMEAHRKLAEGMDIVIGTIESHGRTETAELVDGIPMIPLRQIMHRNIKMTEFNLEAALERKPSIILMDEFAHTNAPGSRHPKRWQDVEELLANGIDVYTTLNVQHLESINDMVAKLTGIIVRETVPDSMFDTADDISLIDIPSDELLKRLHDGKVYIAKGADKRAAQNFFKKTNLVALRELALRRTAERVDAENDTLNAAQGYKEAQLAQKILVCVGHDSLSTRVIRHAKRMATRAKAQWVALYVETERHEYLSDKVKLVVNQNLRLAEKMGAKTIRITGGSAGDEIINYAYNNGFTRIIAGHNTEKIWHRLWQKPLYQYLIQHAIGFEITVVTENIQNQSLFSWKTYLLKGLRRPSHYLWTMIYLAIATFLSFGVRYFVNAIDVSMIYMAMIMIVAARMGVFPALFASMGSIATFLIFFAPNYNFHDLTYIFAFIIMISSSFLVGSLSTKLSLQAKQARKRESETHILYALTKELSSVRGLETMANVCTKHIQEAFKMEAFMLIKERQEVMVYPESNLLLDSKEEGVIHWILENGQIAGKGTDTMPSAKGLYVPLIVENQTIGAIGLMPENQEYLFTISEISQLETFASLIASSLQRAKRANDAENAKVISENEKLRNILLSSISHDLRIPLASIVGAMSSLNRLRHNLSQDVLHLLDIVQTQSHRLTKLVTNLLDATSLDSGAVPLNKGMYHIEALLRYAYIRTETLKENRQIHLNIQEDLEDIEIDGLLIEQIVVNLLDNAIKHTDDTKGIIHVHAYEKDGWMFVDVLDNGNGIITGDEEKIFERFYNQAHHPDGSTGLGLNICKTIIVAHGGDMIAFNQKTGGAGFRLNLPYHTEIES